MWYLGPGEYETNVWHELNSLAYHSAFRTIDVCRAEISHEMAEALWAKREKLS